MDNQNFKMKQMPAIPLRGMVVFPYMLLHFDVMRPKSLESLERAMAGDRLIFLVAQQDSKTEDPKEEDLYRVGTVAKIKQVLKMPGDMVRVLVEGKTRARLIQVLEEPDFYCCEIAEQLRTESEEEVTLEALQRQTKELFVAYAKLWGEIKPEAMTAISSISSPGQLADVIVANITTDLEHKKKILSDFDLTDRFMDLLTLLQREYDILKVERKIGGMVKQQMDKNQRDYFLREQIKAIQTELGEDGEEAAAYEKAFEAMALDEEILQKIKKEIHRMMKLPSGSSEAAVVRSYLDLLLDIPWNQRSEENKDLNHAREVLEHDHYGLEKVKERILEFLAVRQLSDSLHGPILCLVGPPGVGKTSIAKSVAEALGRKFARISLGGVRDEADIRGHRKTYIGAMPGRIISAVCQAGTKNPLLLLDEIDKMSNDFRGDPASAMLEVLDGEQNSAFRDHYVEVPVDLSQVLFLTTANQMEDIPAPLLDRMEIIEISGYTDQEKEQIAIRHLIPKQRKQHGLLAKQCAFTLPAIQRIIHGYTRESGVRQLEREIGAVCRKQVLRLVKGEESNPRITVSRLEANLGAPRYQQEEIHPYNEVGVANGLAWTAVGGVTLSVEVNVMEGSGNLELTGHLGDVMKESAKAAISYIRSKASLLGIENGFYKDKDIHIHIPEGATPKDGPSAGITMASALVSALTGIPLRRDVAMTGEITLRGRVLPIGGLKEKSLAAYRAGIFTVLIPAENAKDLEEIPSSVRDKMQFFPVRSMDEVLQHVLVEQPIVSKKSEISSDSFVPSDSYVLPQMHQ